MVCNVRGEGATIQRWISALPADLVRSRPRLLLVQALLMATSGRLDAVDALLDAAERAAGGAADEPFEPTVGRAASMLVNVPAYIAVDRSYLAQLRGDAEGTAAFAAQALAAIGEGERVAPGPPSLFNPVPAQRARLLLAQGDLAAAARWTKECGLDADDEPDYGREPGQLLLARVLLAQGLPGQALALLDRLYAAAAAQDRTGSVIEAGRCGR